VEVNVYGESQNIFPGGEGEELGEVRETPMWDYLEPRKAQSSLVEDHEANVLRRIGRYSQPKAQKSTAESGAAAAGSHHGQERGEQGRERGVKIRFS
jgi:hypothetical protein